MPYRSIKQVFRKTSLELKCLFLFGLCLVVLIAVNFLLHSAMTEKLVREQNRVSGRLLADQVMFIEHWKGFQLRDDDSYDDLVQNLTRRFKKEDYEWYFIKPDSVDGKNGPRDEFEWKLLDRFPRSLPKGEESAHSPQYAERLVSTDDKDEYQYYQPIRVERICLHCHTPPPGGSGLDVSGTGVAPGSSGVQPGSGPLSEGDLMAILRVTVPYGPTQDAMNWNRNVLGAIAILTVFLGLIGSFIIIGYIVIRPLRHLHDVSEAISRGASEQRAEIHTGDEFESLAVAFNRMLHHLITAQEEQRQAYMALDGKVDELARVNMRLYELNRIKSDFLATMSHELRTPLNSILGFSDVLRAIDSLDEKQKRYVENIRNSGRLLLDMINDILDLAKIESGKMEVRISEFRIEQVATAVCDMARPLSEKKNIDLELTLQPNLPWIKQDQARVQQILNNLISNAIKFTPEGGRVRVDVKRDEYNHLVLAVHDTGIGIAEEDRQVIFEKFRQGQTALPSGSPMTREHSGTGLGLSIVRELCLLLQGSVTVESTLGKGSTFTIRLPWELEALPAENNGNAA